MTGAAWKGELRKGEQPRTVIGWLKDDGTGRVFNLFGTLKPDGGIYELIGKLKTDTPLEDVA